LRNHILIPILWWYGESPMLWLIKLYKLSSFFANGEVSQKASEWSIFKHTVIHYNPWFWEMKHTLKRNIKLLFSSSYPHKAIFFLSFLGSNLWSGKLIIKWVKCGHDSFVEDKAGDDGSEFHQFGSTAVRFTCEKDLTSNGTWTVQPT